MTFRQFVLNNVLRNKRLYAAYFLSSLFTVMVFFTFAIFAFHPTFQESGIDKEALIGMGVAGGIIYVFSFFFVLYSMGSFLQSRKKEFGLLMMHGTSMRQIRLMTFLENMLIGFFATIIGIGLGTLFAKAILLIGENVLIIEESLNFYLPIWPIVITFVSFMALFLVISILVPFFLRSKRLAELVKGDVQPKEEPKASLFLTIVAVVLLAGGYITALLAKGSMVIIVMIPVIIVVIIGTYLLFTQLSVYMIRFLKRRKSIFWKKTNMILLSDVAFRMKDNARTFFMVAIISTVAFSAIGTLFGFQTYLTGGLKDTSDYTFTYTEYDGMETNETDTAVATIESLLEEKKIQTDKVDTPLYLFENVSGERISITDVSTYNALAEISNKEQLHVEKDEIVAVEESIVMIEEYGKEPSLEQPVELTNGERPTVNQTIDSNVLPIMEEHYVVSDELFEQLPKPVGEERFIAWNATSGSTEDILDVAEQATEETPYSFQSIDYLEYSMNKMYGPILFIGLFIGLVFFVSAGSFLYFRLYSDLDEDQRKFASIAKIGLTTKELKKVLTRQTALLFFAPIIVALIHGAVALTALSHLFDYNLTLQSSIVLGCFLLIQIVYFLIVRFVYIKQVKNAL